MGVYGILEVLVNIEDMSGRDIYEPTDVQK